LVRIGRDCELAIVSDLVRPLDVQPLGEVEEHPAVTFGATHEPETFLQRLDRTLFATLVRNLREN
jgi:hypothetical protein